MGTHSARRPRTISRGPAGRGLLTATAAVALVGGSAGTAFAGEAPSHGEGAHETGHQHDQQDCSIPVVDDGTQTVGHVLDGTSSGATGPVLDAADRALAPVHDGLCGPANDVLGQVPGLGSPDDEAGADDEASPDEASADDGTAEEEGTPEEEDAAAPTAAAPGATTVTDLPDVPVTS